MKIFFIILLSIFAWWGFPRDQSPTNELANLQDLKKSDSTDVIKIVVDFYRAFDERDLKTIDSLLSPTCKVIHHNGVITGKEEMIRVIKETKTWTPRQRLLSNYEFICDGNMAVVGVTNQVTILPQKRETAVTKYIETWIFEKTENIWQPVRISYSKVTADKYSEGTTH